MMHLTHGEAALHAIARHLHAPELAPDPDWKSELRAELLLRADLPHEDTILVDDAPLPLPAAVTD